MNEYLITVELPADLSEEFIALIPAHRHRVNELMQEGIITSYSLAADRRRLWTTLIASGEEEWSRR